MVVKMTTRISCEDSHSPWWRCGTLRYLSQVSQEEAS